MIKRIITGLILIGIVVGTFFLRTIDFRLFNILIYVCSIVGTFEMVHATRAKTSFYQKAIPILFSFTLIPLYVFVGVNASLIAIIIALCLCMFSLVVEFDTSSLEPVGISALCTIYPTLPLFAITVVNGLGDIAYTGLLLIFIVAPCTDTFAYFVGVIFKGKKLSPISPKKTISGAIGGLIGGVVGSLAVWFFAGRSLFTNFVAGEIMLFVLIGLIGSGVSQLGDLVEGAIKRKLGIKDIGKIFPGHGGLLDRIDGIIINAVFICLLFMCV